MIAIRKEANGPACGSTWAMIESEIDSGMSARATSNAAIRLTPGCTSQISLIPIYGAAGNGWVPWLGQGNERMENRWGVVVAESPGRDP